jgi:N-acetylglucosaminyl-diphospho-decaprenol L-rhamnosyltransferase
LPAVTAIVVAYESERDLAELLPRLAHPAVECVVIDNASGDDSANVAAAAGARVERLPVNVGWARGCNLGAGLAAGPVLVFLNPDARPTAADLLDLSGLLPHGPVTASPRFINADGTLQQFYFRFPRPLAGLLLFFPAGGRIDRICGGRTLRRRLYTGELPCAVDQPGAACFAVRADLFAELGGFDPSLFLFFADTAFCREIVRRGGRNEVRWDLPVVHRGAGSISLLGTDRTRELFQRDYLAYLRATSSPGAVAAARLAVVALTGLAPAARRALLGDLTGARDAIRLAARVLAP